MGITFGYPPGSFCSLRYNTVVEVKELIKYNVVITVEINGLNVTENFRMVVAGSNA